MIGRVMILYFSSFFQDTLYVVKCRQAMAMKMQGSRRELSITERILVKKCSINVIYNNPYLFIFVAVRYGIVHSAFIAEKHICF